MSKRWLVFLSVLGAALLLGFSLRLPLWQLRMESPQYRETEALKVRVYPGAMRGDLREIQMLNQYIGVHLPETLPQLRWLPAALLAASGFGLLALVLPLALRPKVLVTTAAALCAVLVASAVLAQVQMRRIGHERDPHAALKGVPDFTPPILGHVKIANFDITTTLRSGALLIGLGVILQFVAAAAARARQQETRHAEETGPAGDPAHSGSPA